MSTSKDPIISEVFRLNPGIRWPEPGGDLITEAQVLLIPHSDHEICNAINDSTKRQEQRFRWGIYRLGTYIGRDAITPEMVGALYEPDIERIQQRQVDLHHSFRDDPNVRCPFCESEFSTSLIRQAEAAQTEST